MTSTDVEANEDPLIKFDVFVREGSSVMIKSKLDYDLEEEILPRS